MIVNNNKKTMFSPGKVIITGEHSVVYGQPAVVSAISNGVSVLILDSKTTNSHYNKKTDYEKHILSIFSDKFGVNTNNLIIKSSSTLPQKSGLGSSAAFAHALLQALAKYFSIKISKDEMYNLVFDCEVFIHKNPSGIDPCAVVYGGTHFFIKDTKTGSIKKEQIKLAKNYQFLLINSGSATESTGEMVEMVAQKVKQDEAAMNYIKNMGKISFLIKDKLLTGSFTGNLLDKNQQELEKLGVVGVKAKKMITKIKETGAHAKITGAGGLKTGSGWILAFSEKNEELEKVQQLCNQNNWENFTTTV